MKKTLFILSVLVMTVIAACQKEDFASRSEVKYGSFIIEADMEQPVGDTKTVLNGKTVEWKQGDLIKVFNADGSTSVKMMAQADGASVQFVEVVDEGGEEVGQDFVPAYAIYPYSDDAIIEDGKMKFSTDKEQKYAEGTFGPGANVGLGRFDGNKLRFKNAFGVLKFWLKGAGTVERVVLKGHNNEDLFGNMYVALDDFNEPLLHIEEGQTDNEEIILNCLDGSGNGIDLRASDSTAFYIVVPAGSFGSGFTATAYCGEYNHAEVSTTKNNVVNRSKVKAMNGAKEAYILPKEYIQLDYLESTGTQYTDLGFKANQNTTCDIALSPGIQHTSITYSFLGSRISNKINSFFGCYDQAGLNIDFSDYTKSRATAEVESGKIYRIMIGSDSREIYDGESNQLLASNSTKISDEFETPDNIFLFSARMNGTKLFNNFIGRIFYAKFYENGILIHYFVPCYLINEETGMYDLVTREFRTNEGGGTFGIPTKLFYCDRLEYIESHDGQYIAGPVMKPSETGVECKFSAVNSGDNFQYVFSCGNGEISQRYWINVSRKLEGILFAADDNVKVDFEYDMPYVATFNELNADGTDHICTLNGDYVRDIPDTVNNFDTGNLYILGRRTTEVTERSSIRLYYLKTFNSDDQTKAATHYFYPIKNNINGEVLLFDEITRNFYHNAGTGSFIAGPVVEE